MRLQGTICGAVAARRIFALIACSALLYFALGATLPHGHDQGPDNACHVCQALHMPELAAARLDLSCTPMIVPWSSYAPKHTTSLVSCTVHGSCDTLSPVRL